MKKFSKITKQDIKEEPKLDTKLDESTLIKYKMMNLMDKFLSITTYGPIDRHQRAGLIKISGKEMLAEAISNMLADISIKDKTTLLESLKTEVRDWDVIDNKIENLVKERASINNKNKISKLLKIYGHDEEMLITLVESKSSKISNKNTLIDYSLLISESKSISNDTKSKLIEIYNERIKQIESL